MKHLLNIAIALTAFNVLPFTALAQESAPIKLTAEEAKAEAAAVKKEAADREVSKKLLPAADASPEQVIEALYKTPVWVFVTKNYGEFATRYLTAKLKKELDDDYTRAAEEVPSIGDDVRFNGDAETTLKDVKKLSVKATITGDKATVKASFQLEDAKQVVTYPCEKQGGQWMIADVKYEDGSSVMKLLAEARKYAENEAKEAAKKKETGK